MLLVYFLLKVRQNLNIFFKSTIPPKNERTNSVFLTNSTIYVEFFRSFLGRIRGYRKFFINFLTLSGPKHSAPGALLARPGPLQDHPGDVRRRLGSRPGCRRGVPKRLPSRNVSFVSFGASNGAAADPESRVLFVQTGGCYSGAAAITGVRSGPRVSTSAADNGFSS